MKSKTTNSSSTDGPEKEHADSTPNAIADEDDDDSSTGEGEYVECTCPPSCCSSCHTSLRNFMTSSSKTSNRIDEEEDNDGIGNGEEEYLECSCNCSKSSFKSKCSKNGGFNPLTYTLPLSVLTFIMFITSIILTHLAYNRAAYRDWALAGGVTSNSAQFRVRGPKDDDGIRRQFVVSVNPNLALERFQILVTPVSYGDFLPDEHFFKRIDLQGLTPETPYYYGIVFPQRTPNSATLASELGTFRTPALEGTRMNFTIATGSCSLTGSNSEMFANVLTLNPMLFLHAGDLHYEDLITSDVDERLEAYDKVMGSPTQRLLFMNTIFSYMWDDHDWLDNNSDSQPEEAATAAKQGYELGIPHYPYGAMDIGVADDESTAPKYQAFTIGTVRFIVSDLRSESIKSTEEFPGKIYSDDQKAWLFNELAQAANYDFVIWLNTRSWTNEERRGSDHWGGFVEDRNELSAHIASTIGAGPQNLLVLSGDNHMVAFDDGSSTDFSNQNEYPGGFPILHSGPLAHMGGSPLGLVKQEVEYFTDGCMSVNSDVNHQFSTVDFVFPSEENVLNGAVPCVEIKSYRDDTSNLIFEKTLCSGEMMRFGTEEKDTCTVQKVTATQKSLYIASIAIIGFFSLGSMFILGKRIGLSLSFFGITVLFLVLTIAAAVAGSLCFGTLGIDFDALAIVILVQSILGFIFMGKALFGYQRSFKSKHKTAGTVLNTNGGGDKTSSRDRDGNDEENRSSEVNENEKDDNSVDDGSSSVDLDFSETAASAERSQTKKGRRKLTPDSFSIHSAK